MTAPGDPLARFDALQARGEVEAAIGVAEDAIAAGHRRLPLHFRLVASYLRTDRYRDALALIVEAARLPPTTPAELVELAQRLMYFNQAGVLRQVAARLLAGPPGHAGAEADFAALLSMAGEQTLAARLLQRATASRPGAAALYNRSQMHLYSGRMAEAEADLQRCLVLDPGMAKAHWALSKLPRQPAGEPELAAMSALTRRFAPGSQDEVFLRFALFNRLHQLGRYDEAWGELERGCRAKRRLLSYDAAATTRLFDALRAAFPRAATQTISPGNAITPIFIVGMHRSGTTLLERMLGNHDKVSEGGELYEFPAQLRWAVGRHFSGPSDITVAERANEIDFAAVGRRYLDQVSWRARDKPFLIDKLPSNFLNVGYIQRALPGAKVIHMRRNAMDTCFSNLKELFSNACAYSYDQLELADYYAQYRALSEHWQQVLPGFVLDVDYERLARDPAAEAARILAFCGLDWQPACLDVGSNARAVNTASSAQVREPIHQRGIEAWRRYEQHLEPLATRLASHGLP